MKIFLARSARVLTQDGQACPYRRAAISLKAAQRRLVPALGALQRVLRIAGTGSRPGCSESALISSLTAAARAALGHRGDAGQRAHAADADARAQL